MKRLAIVLTALLCMCHAAAAAELTGVKMFPLEQLKPGLKGTGHTVIRGTQIQTFDVEILELIPKGGFDGGPMILARFSGPVVDFSNGIAGGYSGSPVYISGQLVGAVSMAIPFTDTHIGGITPIQSMLAALPDHKEPDYTKNTVLPPSTKGGTAIDEDGNVISLYRDSAEALRFNEEMRSLGEHRFAAIPMSTPVFTTGVSPNVLAHFKPQLQKLLGNNFTLMERPMGGPAEYGLLLDQAAADSEQSSAPGLFLQEKTKEPPMKGGDAVAVSLITGDIEMSAIGTMTYSDAEGRFLIFGHPMLGIGDTNMPVGKGYVTWTHKSIERAFKEGVRLNTLGTLSQDRSAACGGTFSSQPDMVPIKVRIKDVDLNKETTMKFDVIRHKDFTPALVAMGMSQAANQVLNRQPGGTMKLSYHIEGVGLEEPLRRTNYYSDDGDVIFNAAMELLPITNLLQTNIYRDVRITKLEILLEITRNRINASIDDASIVWDKSKKATEEAVPAAGAPTTPAPAEEAAPQAPPAIYDYSYGDEAYLNLLRQRHQLSDSWPGSYSRLQGDEPVPPQPPQQTPSTGPPMSMPGMPAPMPSPDMPTFAPGDEIKVRVRLQPYHTDPVWREFSLRVPDDFPNGLTTIVVHGGGDLISPSELNGKGRSLFGMGPIIDVKEHDLNSVLNQIMEWPLNNELLVTLVRPYDPAAPQDLGGSGEAEKPEDKLDEKFQMEWVIYNGFLLPVNIVSKKDQQAMAEMQAKQQEAQAQGASAKPAADGSGAEDADKDDEDDDSGPSEEEGSDELPFEISSSSFGPINPNVTRARQNLL